MSKVASVTSRRQDLDILIS